MTERRKLRFEVLVRIENLIVAILVGEHVKVYLRALLTGQPGRVGPGHGAGPFVFEA